MLICSLAKSASSIRLRVASVFEIANDRDSSLVRLKMKKFKEEGIFKVDQKSFNKYEDLFVANYLSDQNCKPNVSIH